MVENRERESGSGKGKEIMGKAKEKWGDVTNNPEMQKEGRRDLKRGEADKLDSDVHERKRERGRI